MELKVNNTTVANWTLTTSFADYNYSLSGSNDIKVYFKDNTGDMILDYINAGGAIYQSENQAVNTSVYQGQCGGSYSDNMHCPGYIDFGKVTIGAAQNQPPLANAGSDKTITLPTNSVTLSGGASDPDGTISSYEWSIVSGPSQPMLSGQSTATVTGSNMTAGTYIYKLTVTDDKGASGNDEVTVIVNPVPQANNSAPVVNAGQDQNVILGSEITLNGSATDDGLPGPGLTYKWTVVSIPKKSKVLWSGSSSTAATALKVSKEGSYVLRLTVSDGQLSNFDTVSISVFGSNTAPTVTTTSLSKSISQSTTHPLIVYLGVPFTLKGEVKDDGLPWNQIATSWRVVGDSSVALFTVANSSLTGVIFNKTGVYELELLAFDGDLSSGANLTVEVTEGTGVQNRPPKIMGIAANEIVAIKIYNLSGTLIKSIDMTNPAQRTLSHTIASVSKSVYIVRIVRVDGKTITRSLTNMTVR